MGTWLKAGGTVGAGGAVKGTWPPTSKLCDLGWYVCNKVPPNVCFKYGIQLYLNSKQLPPSVAIHQLHISYYPWK